MASRPKEMEIILTSLPPILMLKLHRQRDRPYGMNGSGRFNQGEATRTVRGLLKKKKSRWQI